MSAEPGAAFRLLIDREDQARAKQLFLDAHVRPGSVGRSPSDSILLGAFVRDRLVGATASHIGPDEPEPARVDQDRLRVTALAVEAQASGRGVGGRLMQLQRLLALQRDLELATWEQDPLDGRLAHLAIHRLGAVSRRMLAPSSEEPERRLDVEWWVRSPRVRGRLSGARPELDLAHALEAGTPKLNAGRLDEHDLLRPIGGKSPPDGATALVEVPHDLRGLEARDRELAAEWRAHLTRILSGAFAQGYWLTDYLRLRGERVPRAYYLLIDGERTLA